MKSKKYPVRLLLWTWIMLVVATTTRAIAAGDERRPVGWTESKEIALATPKGNVTAITRTCLFHFRGNVPESTTPWYRMIYVPSSRLLWIGLIYYKHFLAYDDRITGFYYSSPAARVRFLSSSRKLPGQGDPAVQLQKELDSFLATAAERYEHGKQDPGFYELGLYYVYQFEPLASLRGSDGRPMDTGPAPDTPKSTEFSFDGDKVVIVFTSTIGNKAAITFTKDLKVVGAGFNNEKIKLPEDIDVLAPGVVPWQ